MIKKAMIMAAGAGTRLNPLTLKYPKPMIPVANTPLLEFILNHLKSFEINDVIANTHYIADAIQTAYTDVEYVYEPELSGTAGGVKKTEFFFDEDETFIVVSGDALTDVDIEGLYVKHKTSKAMATMALKEVPMSQVDQFGVVVLGNNDRVMGFQEKPKPEVAKSNLVNTGIYIFEQKIFKYIPANTFYDFGKQVFPDLLSKDERVYAHVIDDYWNDIGTRTQYRLCCFDMLNNKLKYNSQNTKLYGNSIVGHNSIIKDGAQLDNCLIWDDTTIEANEKFENCIVANINGTRHVI